MARWVLESAMAVLLWGLWAFSPKLAVRYISPASSLVFEALGVLIVGVAVGIFLWTGLQVDLRGVIPAVLTGLCGAAGIYFFFAAAKQGPISVVAAFTALYPVVTVVLAVFFLRERLYWQQGLGVVLAVLAACLLSWERP